jgi:hypothetical protein
MRIDDLTDESMVLAAHEHCLGRRSYIVASCASWLRLHWDQLSHSTRETIMLRTRAAMKEHRAGDQCDFEEWKSFLDFTQSTGP